MTPRQRLELEQSQLRENINKLLTAGELSTEQRNELQGYTTRAGELELELRAAIIADADVGTSPVDKDAADSPQNREIRSLFEQVSIDDYFHELLTATPANTPAMELRAALLGDDVGAGMLPLDLLLGNAPMETRADTVTATPAAIQDTQMPIAGRVFATGATAYLGISQPTVGPGDMSYPRISAGTSADVRSDGVELDGSAATIVHQSVEPVRLTASYTYDTRGQYRIVGLSTALRTDLQGVMSEKQDALAINGQAAVDDTSPAVSGIIGSLTNPTNPSAVVTALDVLNAYTGAVDGKYASTDSAVRMLVTPAMYRHAFGLQIPTSGDLLRDRLPTDRFRASANMPDAASNIETAILYASGANARGYIMPVWRGVELIVDPYTGAKSGRRIITAVMMVGFVQADSAPYTRLEFKTA